jgi:hypothetical protein
MDNHNQMTTRTTKLLSFFAGGVVCAALHFLFYDPVQKSPAFLKPGLLIYYGVLLFVGTNIFVFSFNLLRALLSVRESQDEQEVERVVVPALQGQITDERLMRYTDIPCFFGLGALVAGIPISILR